MSSHYTDEKDEIINRCVRCGACASICPGLELSGLDTESPRRIQTALYSFLSDPEGCATETAGMRISCCIECFKCLDSCPEGLNPLSFIELAREEAVRIDLPPFDSPSDVERSDPFALHQESIRSLPLPEQQTRVTRPDQVRHAQYLFFPGCNIYEDVRRLLKVLDILDATGEDIAFLPGIEHCCGEERIFGGDLSGAEARYRKLEEAVDAYSPETLILWCPTCMVRLRKSWQSRYDTISFFQFYQDHKDAITLNREVPGRKALLHLPCKNVYTGLDASPVRIVEEAAWIELRSSTDRSRCCGSGGTAFYAEETQNSLTAPRLAEAAAAGADTLITVCHYCQKLFSAARCEGQPEVVNLADLIHERLL